MKSKSIAGLVLLGACATTRGAEPMIPPVAERIPHVMKVHGHTRVDDYYWLRNREDPKVLEYLVAENAYTERVMAKTADLRKRLFDELLGRIQEDDASVPYKDGPYWYYSRTEKGKQYRIYCRKKGLEAPEEIILDGNALAEGKEFMRLGALDPSPDHRLLAYAVDENGSERFTLRFKDLSTGQLLPESIADTATSLAWASDNRTIFYTTVDETTRPFKVFAHVLGTPTAEDREVHHEPDDAYFVGVERTRSGKYIVIEAESAITTESRVIDASAPTSAPAVFAPRKLGVEYYLAHHERGWFLWTNEGAINFELYEVPIGDTARAGWKKRLAHREDVSIEAAEAFADHLVVWERVAGLPQIRVEKLSTGAVHLVAFEEAAYDLWSGENAEYDTRTLRFGYTSLSSPTAVYDYELDAKTRTLKKEQPVIGYAREKYVTERVHAKAKDGTLVPITLLHAKDLPRDGSRPMLLEGYGSYGISLDPRFDSDVFSLVDRGFTYAIAHIRGGGELGRRWKEDGKFEKKTNTFTDFIACAEHLIAEKYTSASKLVIAGRSAGGLLMGAVLNMRPELFFAAIAGVPFVDVTNTMLDETIPLTVIEWEEWGNPQDPKYYEIINAYSPYDNVVAQPYPHLLVRAGLNDPRVQYWEPAKWTAKLRALKTDANFILLKTDMGAGHGGQSGRYGQLEDTAFEYAFILDRLGLAELR